MVVIMRNNHYLSFVEIIVSHFIKNVNSYFKLFHKEICMLFVELIDNCNHYTDKIIVVTRKASLKWPPHCDWMKSLMSLKLSVIFYLHYSRFNSLFRVIQPQKKVCPCTTLKSTKPCSNVSAMNGILAPFVILEPLYFDLIFHGALQIKSA